MTSSSFSTDPKIVQRINYGTIFKEDAKLILSKESWTHTFQLRLPVFASIEKIPMCQGSSFCHLFNHTMHYVHSLHMETMIHVNHTVNSIHTLIPETYFQRMKTDRTTRALLPFVGSLFSGLFGTATMNDVNILANHINSLTRVSNSMVNTLHQHAAHISSFMKVIDQRTTNLMRGIQTNYQQITRLTTLFNTTISEFQDSFSNISTIIADQVHKSSSIINSLTNLQNSIESLVQGKLTPFLIPEEILAHTLQHIQRKLAKSHSKFFLIRKHPAQYYKSSDFLYVRQGSLLFVTVKFPISSHRYPLTLYKVISLPVPINSTSTHASQLLDTPDYLAVTHHHQLFVTLSSKQLMDCTKNSPNVICTSNIPLTPVTVPNCMMAMFKNNKTLIKSMCNFRFIPHMLKSTMVELTSTSILLYNVENLHVDCSSYQKPMKGCNFCIFDIPCKCSITSEQLIFTPKLIDCQENLKNVSISYPINLALLQEFFNESKLVSTLGDTLYPNPIESVVPQFQIYNHTFSNVLVDDRSYHLSLKKLAQAAKKDSVAFKSLSEPLLNGDIVLDTDWLDTKSVILYTTLITTICATIGCIFLFCKIRKLATALLVLQRVVNAHSDELPSFIYENLDKQIESEDSFTDSLLSEFHWVHAFILLGVIIFIILIILFVLIYCSAKKNKGTTLYLEVTSGGNCVTIPVAHFPLCPSYFKITVPTVQDVSVSFGKMIVIWENFEITNKLTSKTIKIKQSFNISLLQYLALRSILKQPFCAYIIVGHQRMFTPLQTLNGIEI